MIKYLSILTIALALVACGPDQNTILYNQVMDIHDEVMPKVEDLYNLKKELLGKLKADSTMPADQRAVIETKIAKIDSADMLMMDWMHDFTPPAKDADKGKTREYLEAELEKVKKVKEAILGALSAK